MAVSAATSIDMMHQPDTIAAIATAPGYGGIAIMRISGPSSAHVLTKLFSPINRGATAFTPKPRYMHFGHAFDKSGNVLDEVLAVFMPGPHSATGEDVAEVHCHGGPGVTNALLEAALEAGARLAGPGEFSRRAFLNGRIDLTQAEAVAELISSPTSEGARLAAAKLEGVLAKEVSAIREALDSLRIQVTLAVDFPDEDAELLSRDAFIQTTSNAQTAISRLLGGFERARLWREGALAVLAGKVNAGKSSLLNALLGRQRAIVSPLPGTTRDYIEESINLDGLPLRVMDTAGIRKSGDLIEEEGIRRSDDAAGQADILLWVRDWHLPIDEDERQFLLRYKDIASNHRLLIILNKIDIEDEAYTSPFRKEHFVPGPVDAEAYTALFLPKDKHLGSLLGSCPCYAVSAREGTGLESLTKGMREVLLARTDTEVSASDAVPNLRQSHLLRQAGTELASLSKALEMGHPPDILGVHLDAAVDLLDEVTGSSSNEELLDRIFSSFCIGK